MDPIGKRALEIYLQNLPPMEYQGHLNRYSDAYPSPGLSSRIPRELRDLHNTTPPDITDNVFPGMSDFRPMQENINDQIERGRLYQLYDSLQRQGIKKWWNIKGQEPKSIEELIYQLRGMVRG